MNDESKVFVNESGTIELIYAEQVTIKNQGSMQEKLFALAFQQNEAGLPLKFLVDLSRTIDYDAQAQNLATRGISGLTITKTAAYGARPEVEKIHKALYARSNKLNVIRYFKTREEAIAWLME